MPKTLAEHWLECPVCGLSAARDVVTAQVILERSRIGRSRHNVEDVVSCASREAVAFLGRRSDHDPKMTQAAEIRPSWWYASIGVALALAGNALFAYFLVHGILHLTDSLTQVVVPGHAELSLNTPATYTIFLEEQSVVGGRIYSSTQSIVRLNCSVTMLPGSQEIPLRQPAMSTTYNVNRRSGRSVREFPVKVPGQYKLACYYPQDTNGPQTVLAVGAGVGEKLTQTVLRSLISMFCGMGSGGLVIAIIIVKRRRAAKTNLSARPAPLQ